MAQVIVVKLQDVQKTLEEIRRANAARLRGQSLVPHLRLIAALGHQAYDPVEVAEYERRQAEFKKAHPFALVCPPDLRLYDYRELYFEEEF